MLRVKINIVGLFVLGVFWFGMPPPQVWAEEVGVHFQVLDEQKGVNTTTTSLILELLNLSGNDLSNVSINRWTLSPSLPDEGAVRIGTLTTTESKVIQVSFTIPNEFAGSGEEFLKFYVTYDTADGIPRAAILQGQPTVFIGNPTP